MQKITPFLWFDGTAEEAAKFYTSIFKNSSITYVGRYGEEGPGPSGSVMVVEFEIEGIGFRALNGGPEYKLTPAFSLQIDCDTQEEVDYYWDKLTEGGQEVMCGWLTDRFGVSWQVTPKVLFDLLSDPDKEKSQRVMKAMMGMVKLDTRELQKAAAG